MSPPVGYNWPCMPRGPKQPDRVARSTFVMDGWVLSCRSIFPLVVWRLRLLSNCKHGGSMVSTFVLHLELVAIPKLLNYFWSNHYVYLLLCLGFLLHLNLRLRFGSQIDTMTFSCKICWYNPEFIGTSIMASRTVSEAAKWPQTMMLPPPSFTVGMRFSF